MSKSVLLSPRTHHVNDLTSAAVVRFSGEEHDTAGLSCSAIQLAPDETVILLHPPLPLVGESIVMKRERQQNDSLVNGYCSSKRIFKQSPPVNPHPLKMRCGAARLQWRSGRRLRSTTARSRRTVRCFGSPGHPIAEAANLLTPTPLSY